MTACPIDSLVAKTILDGISSSSDGDLFALFCYLSAAYRNGYLFVELQETLTPCPSEVFDELEDPHALALQIKKAYQLISSRTESHGFYVLEDQKLYLPVAYKLCKSILFHHRRLLNAPVRFKVDLEKSKEELATYKLLPEQKKAILYALEKPVAAIWGGPGTGKTYTAGLFLKILLENLSPNERKALRIVASAPTGKATANLAHSIQRSLEVPVTAKTLHALLELRSFEQKFEQTCLPFDLVIVDESSMVDGRLCERLLSRLSDSSRLLFLGDPDQLPPVEPGAPFLQFIEKEGGLKTSLRAELKEILELAALVRDAKADEAIAYLRAAPKTAGVHFKQFVEKELTEALSVDINFDKKRLLTPMRAGPFGTEAINRIIFSHYVKRLGMDAAIPIMISKNDYQLNLTNGQVGTLTSSEALFDSPVGVRKIPRILLGAYEMAFCLSVHKSQGSEFDEVVVLLPPGSERFGKKMLYTAITRAKKSVTLWTTEEVLKACIC